MHWVLSLRMLFWVHVLCRELWHQALICLKWSTYVGSWVAASAALRHCCTKYLPCLAVRQNALLAVTPVCSSSRESHLPSVLLTESSRDRSKLFKKKKKKCTLHVVTLSRLSQFKLRFLGECMANFCVMKFEGHIQGLQYQPERTHRVSGQI